VCTAVGFRGQGYAQGLVASIVAQLLGEGNIPFLHVKPRMERRHSMRESAFEFGRRCI